SSAAAPPASPLEHPSSPARMAELMIGSLERELRLDEAARRLQPSHQRRWEPAMAVLPYAEFKGNLVRVYNIRNCTYRSETDYDVHHYHRTFDLNRIKSV